MHRLLLFGGGSLEGPQGPVTGRAAQGYRLALLALLAVEHPRPLTRDKLIALLWPDSHSDRARRLLRQSLYHLRGTLGEDALRSAGDELRLDPQRLRCDLWDFRDALDRGEPAAAVAVYAGPFLDGVFVDGADEFERWAEAERAALAQRFCEAVEALAEAAEAGGDLRAAAGAWRRLADHDPFNARYVLRSMRVLDALGDRAGALRHAAAHSALLQAEFGAEPDPDLEALALRLREQPVPHAQETELPLQPRAPPDPEPMRGGTGADPQALPDAAVATRGSGRPVEPTSGLPARGHHRPRRVGVAALALLGVLSVGWWVNGPAAKRGLPAGADPSPDRSIAVLPFADLSADGDGEYFSDGVTEEIIALLARLGEIRVISRTSVMRYKSAERSLPEIARELGVTHVLEGSVRRSGDRLRITAQLIDSGSDVHLWAESYDRELGAETLFAIQSDIAQRIAAALKAELSPVERQRIARTPTRDLAAYDFYLRGRDAMRPYGGHRLEWAVSLFDRALELDPHFVLAEAYRGETYGMLWRRTRREEFRDSALASHLRVLRDAPDLAEGHRLLGHHHLSFGRLTEALAHNRRALELDPGDAGALHDLADIHASQGRLDLALPLAKQAVSLAPTSGSFAWQVFLIYLRLGDGDGAERWYRHRLESVPGSPQRYSQVLFMTVHEAILHLIRGERAEVLASLDSIRRLRIDDPAVISFLASTSLFAGDLEGARRDYERQSREYPDRWQTVLPGLGHIYLKAGDRQRAEGLLREALARAQQRLDEGDETPLPHVLRARVHAVRGETELALRSLEAAYERGWRDYYYTARFDPRYESLSGHPRFEQLMAGARADADRMRARLRRSGQTTVRRGAVGG
jgi:TolB-like protein/DNA-binding SARP family transcriptional activator/Flp pilus assembly protein TadD